MLIPLWLLKPDIYLQREPLLEVVTHTHILTHTLEQRLWTTVCALIPRSPCGIWLWTLARCCYCSSLINQIFNLGRCQIIGGDNEKRMISVELPVKECPLSFLCVLCCYFWDCAQGFWSVCWASSPPLYPTSLLLSHSRATRTNGFKIEAKLKQ